MARFVDMEDGRQVRVEPEEIRKAYRARMKDFVDGLAREADRREMACRLVDTDEPYLNAIESYLGFRHDSRALGR
jgi:hypothetical protein